MHPKLIFFMQWFVAFSTKVNWLHINNATTECMIMTTFISLNQCDQKIVVKSAKKHHHVKTPFQNGTKKIRLVYLDMLNVPLNCKHKHIFREQQNYTRNKNKITIKHKIHVHMYKYSMSPFHFATINCWN